METIRGEWSCRFCGEGRDGIRRPAEQQRTNEDNTPAIWLIISFLPLPAQWSPVLGPVCEIVPINWTRESRELGPFSSCADLCIISAGRRHRCHCHHICHEDTNREETFTQSSETYFPFIYYLISTRECPHIYYLSIPSPATRSRWIIITDANLISYQITDLTDLLMTTWAQMVASCPSVDIYLDVQMCRYLHVQILISRCWSVVSSFARL